MQVVTHVNVLKVINNNCVYTSLSKTHQIIIVRKIMLHFGKFSVTIQEALVGFYL